MDWKNVYHWLYGLVAAIITGSANALLGSFGSAAVGHPLDWEQVWAVGISTGFFGALTYLKQSPLPAETVEIKKTETVKIETMKEDK